jgi:hypothetical protein
MSSVIPENPVTPRSCELRAEQGEAWFELGSLKVTKNNPNAPRALCLHFAIAA